MNNLKEKLKSMKGITLIALIITIIVLLILAGVVINMTLGSDGIIAKAQSSVDKYQNAQEQEEVMLNQIADSILDGKLYGNRDWVSTDIPDFTPVIKSVTGFSIEATVPENIANNTNVAGYIFLLGGEVKELSKNNTYKFTYLTRATSYTVKIIAVDKYGKYKISSDKTQKTNNNTYLYEYGNQRNTLNTHADQYSSISFKTNYLEASSSEDRSDWTSKSLLSINNINLDNINNIYVHFYDVNMTSNCSMFISACTTWNGSDDLPSNCLAIDKKVNQNITNGEFILELDTSQLNGNHKIVFGGITDKNYCGYGCNNDYTGSLSYKVDAVWY